MFVFMATLAQTFQDAARDVRSAGVLISSFPCTEKAGVKIAQSFRHRRPARTSPSACRHSNCCYLLLTTLDTMPSNCFRSPKLQMLLQHATFMSHHRGIFPHDSSVSQSFWTDVVFKPLKQGVALGQGLPTFTTVKNE